MHTIAELLAALNSEAAKDLPDSDRLEEIERAILTAPIDHDGAHVAAINAIGPKWIGCDAAPEMQVVGEAAMKRANAANARRWLPLEVRGHYGV